jgi:hypothetical protein
MSSLRLRAAQCRKEMLVSCPATTQPTARKFWCQIGVKDPDWAGFAGLPSRNHFTVSNLALLGFHGMEEVNGQIRFPSLSLTLAMKSSRPKVAIWKLDATTLGNPGISGAVQPPLGSSTPNQPQIPIS